MTTVSASWELQRAVIAFLAANAEIRAFLKGDDGKVRILDDASATTLMPYVYVGDGSEANIGGECLPGARHSFPLIVCTNDPGFKTAKTIAQALRDALDGQTLSIDGFGDAQAFWVATQHTRSPDQATLRQSAVLFEIELRPEH